MSDKVLPPGQFAVIAVHGEEVLVLERDPDGPPDADFHVMVGEEDAGSVSPETGGSLAVVCAKVVQRTSLIVHTDHARDAKRSFWRGYWIGGAIVAIGGSLIRWALEAWT